MSSIAAYSSYTGLNSLSKIPLTVMSTYLTMKEIDGLSRVSNALANLILTSGSDTERKRSSFLFFCTVLRLRGMNYMEYLVCNMKVNPPCYKFSIDGEKLKSSKRMNSEEYVNYKVKKLEQERKGALFSSITRLDWRDACRIEEHATCEKGTLKGPYKALQALLKFRNLKNLILQNNIKKDTKDNKEIIISSIHLISSLIPNLKKQYTDLLEKKAEKRG